MSKPIDGLKSASKYCEYCKFRCFFGFSCAKKLYGYFDCPCTLEDWARCPFNKDAKRNGAPGTYPIPKPRNANYIDDLKNLKFDYPESFYTACQHYFNKPKKEVDDYLATLPVKPDLDNPAERQAAWLKIIELKIIEKFGSGKLTTGGGESIKDA